MKTMELHVNGRRRVIDALPSARLIDVLRGGLGLTAICDNGVPGAGVVLADGRPVESSLVLAATRRDARIETAEGLIDADPAARALWREIVAVGVGCERCRAGTLATATALLRITTWIDADDARAAIIGHQCRCSGYELWADTIVAAAQALRAGDEAPAARWPVGEVPANLLHARLIGKNGQVPPGSARVLTGADMTLPEGVTAVVLTEGASAPIGAFADFSLVDAMQDSAPGEALVTAPRYLQQALDLVITCLPDEAHPHSRRGDAAPELDALCAALAQREGRPVRLELDMRQALALCPPEPGRRLVVDAEGSVTATPGPASIVDVTIAHELDVEAQAATQGADAAALRLSRLPKGHAATLKSVGQGAGPQPIDEDGRLLRASSSVLAGPINDVAVAALAEVIVDQDTGHVGLARLVLAMPVDVDRVAVTAALERGLGRALHEEPGVDPAALRLPNSFALPPVDWVKRPADPGMTAETAETLAESACAAATLCAVGRAVGIRPGHVPMTNDRLLAAILMKATNPTNGGETDDR